MTKILHERIDAETNMRAYVVANSNTGKFNVVLQDLDSGLVVPVCHIVNSLEAAILKAAQVLK